MEIKSGVVVVIAGESGRRLAAMRLLRLLGPTAQPGRNEGKMNPRVKYEMTQEDLDKIMGACKPVPVMMIGGCTGSSPQENANVAWAELGKRMGFDSMTVEPSNDGERHFTAVPSETDAQKSSRVKREQEAYKQKQRKILNEEIKECQRQLAML